MRIKKGDNVTVVSGKDRGKKGKVIRALPALGQVVVEGVEVHKKHVRPKKAGQKGQIVERPFPVSASNVKILCDTCQKGVRVGYTIEGKQKRRVCKTCGREI